jgi:hypothetical protein
MLRFVFAIIAILACQPASAQYYAREHIIDDLVQKISWLRCSLGQRWQPDKLTCIGEAQRLNYNEIEQAIAQANTQLGGSWRLPTKSELQTLVCDTCHGTKIDSVLFPNTAAEPYWTSSKNWVAPRNRWSISFMTGESYGRFFPEQRLAVRLVSDR